MTNASPFSNIDMPASPAGTTVGYIGLGDMGGTLARRLCETGWQVRVWARRAAALEPFRDIATVLPTPRQVAEQSDILCLCLGDGEQIEEILFGKHQAAKGLRKEAVVVVQSTIEPGRCREMAAQLAEQGVGLIDAPVTGGTSRAREGTLTIPCGGDDTLVARCRPLLESQASLVVHVGDIGCGEAVKLLNNAVYAIQFALADEITRAGEQLGLQRKPLWETIGAGSGFSTAFADYRRSMEMHGKPFPPAPVSFPGGYAGLLSKDVRLLRIELEKTDGGEFVDRAAGDALAVLANFATD